MKHSMTDIEAKTNGVRGDWAIFPPHRTSDSQRWIRLIEEMGELFTRAVDAEEALVHNSIDEQISTMQTKVEPKAFEDPF